MRRSITSRSAIVQLLNRRQSVLLAFLAICGLYAVRAFGTYRHSA